MLKRICIIMCACSLAGMWSGCKRNPQKKIDTLANEGLLPGISNVFTVYDDELKTGGNLFTFPGGENQTVDLNNRTKPLTGEFCIK
ncbi:MAG: hypothetical protein GF384_05200, partial [Elusimicrobia bacterium]|nr:hypothetical protein [Elusimicrobiota bacterium]MBD3412188.1 hypothetical protein [Elusimicrobiota bacterium]